MLIFGVFIIFVNTVNASSPFDVTRNLMKIVIPELYAEHLEDYITTEKSAENDFCTKHIDYYAKLLKEKNLWALQMFDSGTKIPSGLLKGNAGDFGNFDECVQAKTHINGSEVYGKYCLGAIPVNDIISLVKPRMPSAEGIASLMFATCLPESCSPKDFQNIYNKSTQISIEFSDKFCYSESTKPEFTPADVAVTTCLGVLLVVMILSTIYDIFLFYSSQESKHILLTSFSVITNGKKLIAISKGPNQISSLYGLRVISMMWIILGHRYTVASFHPAQNVIDLLKWRNTAGNMYVMGATVSVDTFLVLSGLVTSYVFMSAMTKGVKFNIIAFYLHRYLRLTPVYAVVMVLYITIFIHLGSGPYWKYSIADLSKSCEEHWWTTLLYVQNYVNPSSICISQSWYLSVDTQLYLVAPVILIPLWKWPKIGIIATCTLGLGSMLASFVLGYIYEMRGFILANVSGDFMQKYYMATHTRSTPWCIGILLGYWIFNLKKNNQKISINKFSVILLWCITLGILAACVFTGHNTIDDPYDRIANAFYISLMRPGWALAVASVIILCELGYGGPIHWFLSMPIFEVLSRLTYTMYLIHVGVQTVIIAQNRNAPYITDLTSMHAYWGDYIFTVCTAVILTLALESPIINIEKVILGGPRKKSEKKTIVE